MFVQNRTKQLQYLIFKRSKKAILNIQLFNKFKQLIFSHFIKAIQFNQILRFSQFNQVIIFSLFQLRLSFQFTV